jgi:hypothetical protein
MAISLTTISQVKTPLYHMTKRDSIRQSRLDSLEAEFSSLLPGVLKECAAGRWGLFGQNDHSDGSKYIYWPEAEQLKDMAREIKSMRSDSGEPNEQVERFLHYCSLRGPNVPGEPKVARSLLDELELYSL